ncbi:MAG: histidinol dehydrogenase [Solirubrobacterales bacterium]
MPVKRFPSDVTAAEIRSLSPDPPVTEIAEILSEVKAGGDRAVLEFEHRFAGAPLPAPDARLAVVDPEFVAGAPGRINSELRAALELAIENVSSVARSQIDGDQKIDLPQGQTLEYVGVPLARAGVYVPGGRGAYPSTAVMCLATARAAGVESICVVSPARAQGEVDPTVAAVCALLEVNELYAIGGAQAVAALGFGTETMAAVDVIVGPGNSYVQEAKRQLVGRVGIDGVAGPSELVVVADAHADPRAIALDLLAQGEHGPDSLVVLVSPDPAVLDDVIERSGGIGAEMAVVLAHDIESAVALADAIAPEHLQISTDQETARRLADSVTRAGCVFLGPNGATAFGDYVAGSNHVLPTGGAARYASALSATTFRRRTARVTIPDSAVVPLARAGAIIAHAEGFSLHAKSMEARNK